MADGGHRLVGVHRIAREIDHRVPHAHLVGRVTARDDQRVEILHARRAGGDVRRDDRLSALALELCARRRPDDRDSRARRPQRLERARQLAILEFIFDEHRDALARQYRSVTHVAIVP